MEGWDLLALRINYLYERKWMWVNDSIGGCPFIAIGRSSLLVDVS